MYAALAARDGPLLKRLASEHFLNGLPAIRSLYAAQSATAAADGLVEGQPARISRRKVRSAA